MLDKQISSIKEQLKLLPPGKLVCSQNGEYQKWYQSDGHKKIYIPKANKQLAEQLARKKYLSLLLEDLKNEKRNQLQIANSHSEYRFERMQELFAENPKFCARKPCRISGRVIVRQTYPLFAFLPAEAERS